MEKAPPERRIGSLGERLKRLVGPLYGQSHGFQGGKHPEFATLPA